MKITQHVQYSLNIYLAKRICKQRNNRYGFFMMQCIILCVFCMATLIMMSRWFSYGQQLHQNVRTKMKDLLQITSLCQSGKIQPKSVLLSGSSLDVHTQVLVIPELKKYAIAQPVRGFTLTRVMIKELYGWNITRFLGILDG